MPENEFSEERQIGVIAQACPDEGRNSSKIYPELVITDGNEYKTVDYPKLAAVLLEAIKTQDARQKRRELKNAQPKPPKPQPIKRHPRFTRTIGF